MAKSSKSAKQRRIDKSTAKRERDWVDEQNETVARLRKDLDHIAEADLLLLSPGSFAWLLATIQKTGGRQAQVDKWGNSKPFVRRRGETVLPPPPSPPPAFFQVTGDGGTVCDDDPTFCSDKD